MWRVSITSCSAVLSVKRSHRPINESQATQYANRVPLSSRYSCSSWWHAEEAWTKQDISAFILHRLKIFLNRNFLFTDILEKYIENANQKKSKKEKKKKKWSLSSKTPCPSCCKCLGLAARINLQREQRTLSFATYPSGFFLSYVHEASESEWRSGSFPCPVLCAAMYQYWKLSLLKFNCQCLLCTKWFLVVADSVQRKIVHWNKPWRSRRTQRTCRKLWLRLEQMGNRCSLPWF